MGILIRSIEHNGRLVKIESELDRNNNSPASAQQRQDIVDAVNEAIVLAGRGRNAINNIWDKSGRTRRQVKAARKSHWRRDIRFVTWFGERKLTNNQIRLVRKRILKIQRWLTTKDLSIIIVHHQDGDQSFRCNQTATGSVTAFARNYLPLRIGVCPVWFSDLNTNERAGVLLHEMVHEIGFNHKRGAVDSSTSQSLARNHPKLARKNPENYEHFFLEF